MAWPYFDARRNALSSTACISAPEGRSSSTAWVRQQRAAKKSASSTTRSPLWQIACSSDTPCSSTPAVTMDWITATSPKAAARTRRLQGCARTSSNSTAEGGGGHIASPGAAVGVAATRPRATCARTTGGRAPRQAGGAAPGCVSPAAGQSLARAAAPARWGLPAAAPCAQQCATVCVRRRRLRREHEGRQ